LSQADICKLAKLKTIIFASVKSGENPKLYPYYSVFRIYLPVLRQMGKKRLIQFLEELLAALEADYNARHRLL
jgi:hypothetical protein